MYFNLEEEWLNLFSSKLERKVPLEVYKPKLISPVFPEYFPHCRIEKH